MRVTIQRVNSASVIVDNEIVGSIQKGLLILLGISRDDTLEDGQLICRKSLGARLWDDGEKAWAKSVMDNGYEILIVSQFTLYGSLKKQTKPDFHLAMKPGAAQELFDNVVQLFRNNYSPEKIQTGKFGAMMNVKLENDGPTTINLDSTDWGSLKKDAKPRDS